MQQMSRHIIFLLILVSCFSQAVWASPMDGIADSQASPLVLNQSNPSYLSLKQEFFLGTPLNATSAQPLRERPLQAAGWNLLPIFGYGSHQQGDAFGGTVLGVLDGITWTTFLLGFSPLGGNYQFFTYFMIGSASFVAGRIFGLIAPFAYSENQRALEQEALAQVNNSTLGVSLLQSQWAF